MASTIMGCIMGASPDVRLVPSALHIVKGEVGRDRAEVGAFSWLAVEVPKLPKNINFIQAAESFNFLQVAWTFKLGANYQ